MFTGLVKAKGQVTAIDQTDDGARIEIESDLTAQLNQGDSIAVNGACLTVTDRTEKSFSADVMRESLNRTTLGELDAGEPVNLELPLAAGDKLGGHIVQGHVDGVGDVLGVSLFGFAKVVRLRAPAELAKYIVEKGSIAIDGVSLTVSAVGPDWFEVSLIPETSERTTLGTLYMGMHVNLEADILAKHVERLLQHPTPNPQQET